MTDLQAVLRLRKSMERQAAVPLQTAAQILQLSVRSVYRKIDAHELEALRCKGQYWITLRSLETYMRQRQYHPGRTFDIASLDGSD